MSNEYTVALRKIYKYGKDTLRNNDNDEVIGNIMRRVLEGFSTFVYKKGIDDIRYDEMILTSVPEIRRDYYKYLMYRLVLNTESHFQDTVKGNVELQFSSLLSCVEKKKTAKNVISFMYELSPKHILFHIYDKNSNRSIEQQFSENELLIKSWIAEIDGIVTGIEED